MSKYLEKELHEMDEMLILELLKLCPTSCLQQSRVYYQLMYDYLLDYMFIKGTG